jgi:hypothetical protein
VRAPGGGRREADINNEATHVRVKQGEKGREYLQRHSGMLDGGEGCS